HAALSTACKKHNCAIGRDELRVSTIGSRCWTEYRRLHLAHVYLVCIARRYVEDRGAISASTTRTTPCSSAMCVVPGSTPKFYMDAGNTSRNRKTPARGKVLHSIHAAAGRQSRRPRRSLISLRSLWPCSSCSSVSTIRARGALLPGVTFGALRTLRPLRSLRAIVALLSLWALWSRIAPGTLSSCLAFGALRAGCEHRQQG